MQAFNPKTQQLEDVVWSVDRDNEIVCTFADDHFLKFPAGTTKAELKELLAAHKVANKGQEIITPEMEEKAAAQRTAAEELTAELNGNTMPQEDKTDVPDYHPV